jgi:hypothetical protein
MGPDHARRFALNKPDTPVLIGFRSRFDECDALRSASDRLELTRPDETREAAAARCVSGDGWDLPEGSGDQFGVANPVRLERDRANPLARSNESFRLRTAKSRRRLRVAHHGRTLHERRYAAANCSKTAKTSSSCVLGVTLGMTCATIPSGPMMKVARRAPKYLRPYMLFSAHTP